jgi:hypothetical protein
MAAHAAARDCCDSLVTMTIERLRQPHLSLLGMFGLLGMLGLAACGDDTTPGVTTAETGGTADTETGGTDTETGGNDQGDGDGDGDSGDGDGDGDGDPLPTEIIVAGEVTDFFLMTGIEGANISVKDMPGFETVSGLEGAYEIPGMPVNTEVFFLLDGNESMYWGGIRPARLGAMDIDDLQLGQISNLLIDQQVGFLQQQDPNIMADETKGVIVVRLLQPTAATEGTGATVTMLPPPPAGSYYSADGTMDNSPVLNHNKINSSVLPFWVSFNNEPDDVGGAVTIVVSHDTRTCTVLHPVFPTRARYVTLVEVDCPPA